MAKIVKAFNIASIESMVPNPNAATGTEGIETSNVDNSVVPSDSVNSDDELQATTTTNTSLKILNVPVHLLLRDPNYE